MKVRNGFVSNSSTSSFLIYGVEIGEDELKAALSSVGKIKKDEEDEDCDLYDALDDALDEALKGSNLGHHHPEGGEIYVGASWGEVGDDQTGKQFKEEVEKELKEKLGIDAKCGTHEYAWRDG